jgi:transposase-like protein
VTLQKPHELNALFKRLRKLISAPGTKARLAREIGVSPQRISDWLAGLQMPGGEFALRLNKWVIQAEESKSKTLPGTTNTRKGKKTRKRKSVHETQKSSPKEE